MKADNRRRLCRCNARLHLLSSPLLFLFLILPAPSFAQITSDIASPTTPGAPASAASTVLTSPLLPTTFSTSAGSPPTNTASKSLSQSIRTTSVASRVTADNAPPLYPASTSATSDDHDIDRDSHLINYYFVFLALIGVFALLAIYVLHKRRRRRKAQLRSSGQNALARDLDGWVNTRRWVHGSWRGGAGGGPARQEEGLNEAGEAPPPYKPHGDATADAAGADVAPVTLSSDESRDTVTGLAIPLRTLSRGGRSTLKPPDYQETIHPVSVNESTRPNTTETRPGTSTRELLHPDTPSDSAA
ncbi:uncharacterized protein BDZ99DRAFT_260863 [Mytilinidion resinicola]|uniref:Uncharacterized protein n=1 Tax=Mytilinidion resinicola TaxID=574789 RepID=A0A6A6YVS6_9PEZI|nr:uncharacterized protein BDZ99DRAFT_260863 [Mytilinidion resinicola]KAF2812085.1 hypothetical protein BDZ99DRAFT_260863 [Mytilinidion resinicola]